MVLRWREYCQRSLHVTNQDWARLPALQTIYSADSKGRRDYVVMGTLRDNKKQRQQRKSRIIVADVAFVDVQQIISSHYMM